MCGILGVALAKGSVDSELLKKQRDTMLHRGPDDAGVWLSAGGRVGLAHRRLAVIDLSLAGHQPMSVTGGFTIVFNGEIYNYRELRDELRASGHSFRTQTDTEVILEAYRRWGADCVHHLSGMFAFAIWDDTRQQLFLARDRAGEKPLFYSDNARGFFFASELKALLADPAFPRKLDRTGLEFYLAYGYVPYSHSILQGVKKLPQGHALTYHLPSRQLQTWAYWTLPDPAEPSDRPEEELVDELHELLRAAVRRQLVADVPIGVMLSGGLDSSLVTAVAAEVCSARLNTFTISFPGHGSYNESKFARIVADHFGTNHTELEASGDSVELVPKLAAQYDEPIADSSMVPTFMVSRMIRQHATVALGGDGGDELFGGYPWHSRLLRQERVRRALPAPVRRSAMAVIEDRLPIGFRGRGIMLTALADPSSAIAQHGVLFDRRLRSRLVAPLKYVPPDNPEGFKHGLSEKGTLLQRITATDFKSYLVDDILVKVDRASMLTSLEVRAPFLDHKIIEFAYGRVPDALRTTGTQRKILLRRLAERLLPPALDIRRKQGFSIPIATWSNGRWGRYAETTLLDSSATFFDRTVLKTLFRDERRKMVHAHRVFALLMLELWRRTFRISAD